MGIGIGIGISIGKLGGASPLIPSNVFPANIAKFDLDFANSQFFGGTQPAAGNTDDGRMLRQQIVNTQPSFVENADGSLKTFTSTQLVRWSTRGLAVSNDRQNRVVRGRDFTNGSWVKSNGGADVTVLKNQTGRDKVANSASQVTVNTDGATILQSITVTSLTYKGWVDVKRLSGSGTIEMTMDNGTAWTVLDLTKPVYNGICRPSIPTQTLANPTVGFRFSKAGDVWLLDCAEISDAAGGLECEPIPTTTASVKGWRDRASAYNTDSGPLAPFFDNEPIQVLYFEYAQRQNGALIASDSGIQITSNDTVGFGPGGAVLTANKPNFSPDARLNVINKAMCYMTPSGSAACLNGGAIVRDSVPFAPNPATTHWDFGTNGAGALSIQGMIKRMWFGKIVPTDAVMQAFTT